MAVAGGSRVNNDSATSALQVTANTYLASLDSKLSNPMPVSGTFWQATQPISATSLPLPAGASTSALQTTGNTSLASIDSKIPALGQALAAASVPVVLTAAQLTTLTPLTTVAVTGTFWQATQPISAASLPLPTGAATAANQATANASLAAIDAGIPVALGQTTKANSMPVVLPSDQVVPVTIEIFNSPFYEDMGVSTGGVARGTNISTTFTDLYSFSGTGFFYGFTLNLNGIANWNVRLVIDGTDYLMGATGISLSDANSNTVYGVAQAKMLGIEIIGATSFLFELGTPIKFSTSIAVKAKITGGAKPFTGGFAVRSI